MPIKRPPVPALRPFVAMVWAGENPEQDARDSLGTLREHVLPTGMMHLVFRFPGSPLRLFDSQDDRRGRLIGDSVVGGARSRFYIREVSYAANPSVGAVLRPGASELLFGVTAAELSERHTSLEDLWGVSARSVQERLSAAPNPQERLALLESVLMARLPRVRGMHPAVAAGIDQMSQRHTIDEVVKHSGFSHRHFIKLFRGAVGLPPKTYSRVLRFQNALKYVETARAVSWVEIATAMGYSDQAHFNRDFLEFSGVTPGEYLRRLPAELNHLPVGTEASRRKRGQFSSRF